MKRQKRKKIYISLLLAGALCLPRNVAVRGDNTYSEDIELFETDAGAAHQEIDDTEFYENGSNHTVSEEGQRKEISENSPGNSCSENIDAHVLSENQYGNEEIQKDITRVVLPTEIPAHMVLLQNRRNEGIIDSKQFYIENRGFEDVLIVIKGVCRGREGEEYFFSDASVRNTIIKGKKNAWICVKWEDENGEELEIPRTRMGDVFDPGEGEIILKAPKRDAEGEITSDHPDSKIYFSFEGDLNSETGEIWEDSELKLELYFSVKTIVSENATEPSQKVDSTDDIIMSDRPAVEAEKDSVSDNGGILDEKDNMVIDDSGPYVVRDVFDNIKDTDALRGNEVLNSGNNILLPQVISADEVVSSSQ